MASRSLFISSLPGDGVFSEQGQWRGLSDAHRGGLDISRSVPCSVGADSCLVEGRRTRCCRKSYGRGSWISQGRGQTDSEDPLTRPERETRSLETARGTEFKS